MNLISDPKTVSAGHDDSAAMLDVRTRESTPGILTIDLDAIAANWSSLDSRAVPAECAAVVKADAYGCGLVQVTRRLAIAGCKTFFVATLDEAKLARKAARKATIYVLNGFFSNCGDGFAELNCRPVIGDLGELAEWESFRRSSGWRGPAAIQIDTGMNRLGLTIAEAQSVLPWVQIEDHGIALVMSHLSSSEDINHPANTRQLDSFREIASRFTGIPASLASSSGIFLGPQFQFDMVRPGAALYGVNPTPEADTPMHPVVNLRARIAQIRDVPKGDTVGYGGIWTAHRPTKLAIVTAGYADGYFRAAGSIDGMRSAEVIVAGQRCPVAGRISMDLIAIDITDVPEGAVRRGQFVTLIGEGITVDELAQHFDTIGYEVLTNLGRRFARVYRGEV